MQNLAVYASAEGASEKKKSKEVVKICQKDADILLARHLSICTFLATMFTLLNMDIHLEVHYHTLE